MNVAFGCCVGTWEKFEHNSESWTDWSDGAVFYRTDQSSISTAYNSILDEACQFELEALVLAHDDLELTDPLGLDQVFEVMDDDVAIVGAAGGGPCMHWWNHEPIGHQLTDSMMIDFGQRSGDVAIVEGSFMVFSPWAVANLRFDEEYEFLGYDDVCLHAREAGRRVVVADVDTHHHTTVGYKSDAVREMWIRSEARFRQKWGNTCACS